MANEKRRKTYSSEHHPHNHHHQQQQQQLKQQQRQQQFSDSRWKCATRDNNRRVSAMKCKLPQNKDANNWWAQQPAVTQTQQQQDLHTTVGAGLRSSDTRSPEATKGRKQEVE